MTPIVQYLSPGFRIGNLRSIASVFCDLLSVYYCIWLSCMTFAFVLWLCLFAQPFGLFAWFWILDLDPLLVFLTMFLPSPVWTVCLVLCLLFCFSSAFWNWPMPVFWPRTCTAILIVKPPLYFISASVWFCLTRHRNDNNNNNDYLYLCSTFHASHMQCFTEEIMYKFKIINQWQIKLKR